MATLPSNAAYGAWLRSLKDRIRTSQLNAAMQANTELLKLYWYLGGQIVELEKKAVWGSGFLKRLSGDLQKEFPGMEGFSETNLKYIRLFFIRYKGNIIMSPQAGDELEMPPNKSLAELENGENYTQGADYEMVTISPQAGDELELNQYSVAPESGFAGKKIDIAILLNTPWGHHKLLLSKAKELAEIEFYLKETQANSWSRKILEYHVSQNLYARQGGAITNFSLRLPAADSDLARETFKNPYVFDFLTLGHAASERDVEEALSQHMTKFLLELGRGFAFVGRQVELKIEEDSFYADLIFFNTRLKRYVVVELKIGEFRAEYASKLSLYCMAFNEQHKEAEYEDTIGLLLCRTPNKTLVKYSLHTTNQPIGVAEYELNQMLLQDLKGQLPSIAELENELAKAEAELAARETSSNF
jgi:predicted nuclease of restriction endonuclease-like (RecB) superfamily